METEIPESMTPEAWAKWATEGLHSRIALAIGGSGAQKPVLAVRSPQWPAFRRAHLLAFPTCSACGGKDKLEVHHIKPYHLFPALELEPTNVMTLCELPSHNCHFYIGHLLSWQSFNETAVHDAALILFRIKGRP